MGRSEECDVHLAKLSCTRVAKWERRKATGGGDCKHHKRGLLQEEVNV